MPEIKVTSFLTILYLGSTIFWADLVSVHYSRKTRNWLEANNVSYVAKDMNPPNVPELRPIERYWSALKGKLRNDGHITKSEADFSRTSIIAKFNEPHQKKTTQFF